MASAPRSAILYSEGWKITGLSGSSTFMKDFACFRAGVSSFEKDPKAVKSVAKNIAGLETVATWIILWSLFLNLNKQLLTVEIFPPQHKIFSVRMCTEIKFEVRCCAMKSRATRRSYALKKALIMWRKDRSLSTFDSVSNCVLCVLFFTPRHSKMPTHWSLLSISSSNLWTELKALALTQILLPILMPRTTFLWSRLQGASVELDSFE